MLSFVHFVLTLTAYWEQGIGNSVRLRQIPVILFLVCAPARTYRVLPEAFAPLSPLVRC